MTDADLLKRAASDDYIGTVRVSEVLRCSLPDAHERLKRMAADGLIEQRPATWLGFTVRQKEMSV